MKPKKLYEFIIMTSDMFLHTYDTAGYKKGSFSFFKKAIA